jgi:hypothetical protein
MTLIMRNDKSAGLVGMRLRDVAASTLNLISQKSARQSFGGVATAGVHADQKPGQTPQSRPAWAVWLRWACQGNAGVVGRVAVVAAGSIVVMHSALISTCVARRRKMIGRRSRCRSRSGTGAPRWLRPAVQHQ